MKYEKNQYSEGVSLCSLIIAGAFIYWGINNVTQSKIWGLILIFIGLSIAISQFYAFTNRGKLRNIVLTEFEQNPQASIEEICEKTGISRRDVKTIILDLKAEGSLLGKFSPSTGQMENATVHSKKLSNMPVDVQSSGVTTKPVDANESASIAGDKRQFCANCGTHIDERNAKYCQYCGFEL